LAAENGDRTQSIQNMPLLSVRYHTDHKVVGQDCLVEISGVAEMSAVLICRARVAWRESIHCFENGKPDRRSIIDC
jgi:hypothetical protein